MKKRYVVLSFMFIITLFATIYWSSTNTHEAKDIIQEIKVKGVEDIKGEANQEAKHQLDDVAHKEYLIKYLDEYIKTNLDPEYIMNDELYKKYRDVILSEKQFAFHFLVSDSEKAYYLNNIKQDEFSFTPEDFTFLDMNADNVPEVVIRGTIGGSAGFVLVLREYDNKMIAHEFSHRGMNDIKKDGSYLASGGAGYNGYYRLSFVENDYIQCDIIRMDTEEDDDHNYKQVFFLGDQKIDEDEFWELWGAQESLESPIWIKYKIN